MIDPSRPDPDAGSFLFWISRGGQYIRIGVSEFGKAVQLVGEVLFSRLRRLRVCLGSRRAVERQNFCNELVTCSSTQLGFGEYVSLLRP